MRYTRTRTALAIVGIGTLAYILGCGPGGQVEPRVTTRVVQQTEECARDNGSCFMLHVLNDGDYQVAVSVNGWRVGEVGSHSSGSFPVPDSRLRHGRCAFVSLWLIGLASRLNSDEQCVREGGYYTLQLDVLYHVFLTPWGGR